MQIRDKVPVLFVGRVSFGIGLKGNARRSLYLIRFADEGGADPPHGFFKRSARAGVIAENPQVSRKGIPQKVQRVEFFDKRNCVHEGFIIEGFSQKAE